jgi:alkylhydroperoxidase family enzyme
MNAPAPRVTVEAEPFIPYVPDEQVVDRLRSVVEPYVKRMGFLPNALKLYAYRPEIAETLFRLNSNVMRDPSSTINQLFKRKLAAIACKTNGCAYCTAHSCSMLKRSKDSGSEGWGLTDGDLQELLSGEYLPKNEFERVCIDYVVAASTDAPNVPDEILARLKQHATPPQIIELACVVGFWKFYNTVHDSLHIPIESHLLQDSGWVDA